MSNEKKETNVWERITKLWFSIGKMLLDGVRDPERVAETLQNIVDEEERKVYLRRLFETEKITVDVTDGTETFASSGLFTGGVYGLTLPPSKKATPVIGSVIWEIILGGVFSQLFRSLGERRGRWTESQVVAFCRDHRDRLRTGGYGTFFEVEGGFVAFVYFVDSGRFSVSVRKFSHDDVWSAEYLHRLVTPQQ